VFIVVAMFGLVCAWVRYRDELRQSLQDQMKAQTQMRESARG
jgi:hypothetical protein